MSIQTEVLIQAASELARLTEEAQCGGNVIAVLNRDGGHRIAEVGYRKASEEAIARHHEMDAEIAALRERCERLRRLALAHDAPRVGGPTGGGTNYRLLTLNECRRSCYEHNDLTPPKETSDG